MLLRSGKIMSSQEAGHGEELPQSSNPSPGPSPAADMSAPAMTMFSHMLSLIADLQRSNAELHRQMNEQGKRTADRFEALPAPVQDGRTRRYPHYRDGDDFECFLESFKRISAHHRVPDDQLMHELRPQLSGVLREVEISMTLEEADNFQLFVERARKRLGITPEAARRRFRGEPKKPNASAVDTAYALQRRREVWFQVAKVTTMEDICFLIDLEQLLFYYPSDVGHYVLDKDPKTLQEAAEAADRYMEMKRDQPALPNAGYYKRAQPGQHISHKDKPHIQVPKDDTPQAPLQCQLQQPQPQQDQDQTRAKDIRRCFSCGQTGHLKSQCMKTPKSINLLLASRSKATRPGLPVTPDPTMVPAHRRQTLLVGDRKVVAYRDSGAEISAIHRSCVEPGSINYRKRVLVKGVMGPPARLPTARIPVQYKGWKGHWTFAVYRECECPALLGDDLFFYVQRMRKKKHQQPVPLDSSGRRNNETPARSQQAVFIQDAAGSGPQNTMGDQAAALTREATSEGNLNPGSMAEGSPKGVQASPHQPPGSQLPKQLSGSRKSLVDNLQRPVLNGEMHHAKKSRRTHWSSVDCQQAQSPQKGTVLTVVRNEESMSPTLSSEVGELQGLASNPGPVVAEGAEPEDTCTETSRKEDFQGTLQPTQKPTPEPGQQFGLVLSMEGGQSVLDNVHNQSQNTVAEQQQVSDTPEDVLQQGSAVTDRQQGPETAEVTSTVMSVVPRDLAAPQSPASDEIIDMARMLAEVSKKEEKQLGTTTPTESTFEQSAPSIEMQQESLTSLSPQEHHHFQKEPEGVKRPRAALRMEGEDMQVTPKTKRSRRRKPQSLTCKDKIS